MSEETRIAKFEVVLEGIRAWFNPWGGAVSTAAWYNKNFVFAFGSNQYRLSFLDKYNSNPYNAALQKIAGGGMISGVSTTVGLLRNIKATANNNTIDDVVKLCKAFTGTSEDAATRNSMIFWMLLMAALDDEIYNNELNSIIDIAYAMNFNEAMIRDWCRAVEYIMQGNQFQEGCNFECETVEGAEFFLHKKENGNDQSRANAVPKGVFSLFK